MSSCIASFSCDAYYSTVVNPIVYRYLVLYFSGSAFTMTRDKQVHFYDISRFYNSAEIEVDRNRFFSVLAETVTTLARPNGTKTETRTETK